MFTLAEATVTLTAPSSPPCFGQTYKLTCTHPVLDGDILLGWERNGTGFNPQSTPNHDDDGNTTTTTLTITVTREEFENKVYTFRCITFDLNVGLSDPNRDISNEVTIDRPGESKGFVLIILICTVLDTVSIKIRNILLVQRLLLLGM